MVSLRKKLSRKKQSIKKSVHAVQRKVPKSVKVGVAGAQLFADLTNPIKMGKVGINAARGKGLVLPGSKYIGPGNSMNKGKGNSSADRAALKHDKDYDALLKSGVKAKHLYGGYSDADARLMKRSKVTTKHGLATYGVMKLKKTGYKLGLSGKRIRDPKGYVPE